MRILLVTILLAVFGTEITMAQPNKINKRAESYMVRQITNQLVKELSDLPVNVRRMAVYKINYESSQFNNQSIAYIKGEIEATLRENSPVSVISPPELDPTDKLKIMGSDSTLQIMNIKGRSLADMSPELLERVTQKYSVDGLAELTIQQMQTEGLVVLIRIMNPQSREIVWSKSFESYPVEIKEKEDVGKRVILNFGVKLLENESFTLGAAPGSEVVVDSRSFNYNFNIVYRQPLNENNSSYLGLFTGINVISPVDDPGFESRFWEIGLTFDQALSQKSVNINDFRVMLGIDASMWLAQGEREGDLLTISPSIMFNLTNNIGFELNGMAFLTERTIKQADTISPDTYTFGQIGYGVTAYVRF